MSRSTEEWVDHWKGLWDIKKETEGRMSTIKYWSGGQEFEIDRESCIFTDRSRIEAFKNCEAYGFYNYKEGPEGRGVVSAMENEDLVTGRAVHKGLEHLALGLELYDKDGKLVTPQMTAFQTMMELYAEGKLQIGRGEETNTLLSAAPELAEMLALEQAWMAYAFVWLFERRWWSWLNEEYEIVGVEEEIPWQLGWLAEGETDRIVILLSRLDLVTRRRSDGRLVVFEYKTKKDVDTDTLEDLGTTEQGMAQMLACYERYGEWPAGVQYFFFIKGDKRYEEAWQLKRYANSLVRPYGNHGGQGDPEAVNYAWSYNYTKADGKGGKLTKEWSRRNIWEEIGVPGWLEMVDAGWVQPGEGRDWLSEVVSKPELTEYSETRMQRWRKGALVITQRTLQMESVEDTVDHHQNCRRFRSPCLYRDLCYGSGDVMTKLAQGKLVVRVPNHPLEIEEEMNAEVGTEV